MYNPVYFQLSDIYLQVYNIDLKGNNYAILFEILLFHTVVNMRCSRVVNVFTIRLQNNYDLKETRVKKSLDSVNLIRDMYLQEYIHDDRRALTFLEENLVC